MKKGLLIVPFMTGKGGTETVIHNLFEDYKVNHISMPFKIIVYSIGGSENYGWTNSVDNIHIKFISKYRIMRTLYYMTCLPFYLFRIIKNEKPSFIISTNPVMWCLAFYIIKLLHFNTKIISWYHYSLKRKPVKLFLLRAADFYFAISNSIKKELISQKINEKRIFTIYNPIISNEKLIPRPQSRTKFIYLGRLDLDGQKNLRELIDACSGLKGDWSLELLGDDANVLHIKEYAKKRKILNKLKFRGFVDKPWEYIDQASALILCSKYEGYPMVVAEALSHGIYCIVSNIEGSKELIRNNENGDVYELNNPKQLAEKMQKLIDNPKALPNQLEIQKSVKQLLPDEYLNRFNTSVEKILSI